MSFFGSKRLIVILVGLVILISVMGFTSGERASLTWPEKFTRDSISLMQGFFNRPAQAFSHFFSEVGNAYQVYEENRVLKANLDQFAQLTAKLKVMESENARLRSLLDVTERLNDYQYRVAEVVARSTDHWRDVLVINKGLKHGIKKNMAVITAAGLIGQVESVTNFSSTVELLTSIQDINHISAMIIRDQPQADGTITYKQINGVVEEYDPRIKQLIMRKIPLEEEIEVNQQVVTSGMGGVIPRGLLIGTVVHIEPGDYGLTQTAFIQPSSDFSQLNEVMVVERAFATTSDGAVVPAVQMGEADQKQADQNQVDSPNNAITDTTGGEQ